MKYLCSLELWDRGFEYHSRHGRKLEYSFLSFPSLFLALQPSSGLGHLHETFRFTSVTRARTVGRKASTYTQTQKNAHTTQTLNIHAQSEIRTHDHSVRAREDGSCLRPLGNRNRQKLEYWYVKNST
jgi:uncharacterized protein YccT (UPF0319 family)